MLHAVNFWDKNPIFGIWLSYLQRQLDLIEWVTKVNFAFCETPYYTYAYIHFKLCYLSDMWMGECPLRASCWAIWDPLSYLERPYCGDLVMTILCGGVWKSRRWLLVTKIRLLGQMQCIKCSSCKTNKNKISSTSHGCIFYSVGCPYLLKLNVGASAKSRNQ